MANASEKTAVENAHSNAVEKVFLAFFENLSSQGDGAENAFRNGIALARDARTRALNILDELQSV